MRTVTFACAALLAGYACSNDSEEGSSVLAPSAATAGSGGQTATTTATGAATGGAAQGGASEGPCNENPWSCAAGQTCWLDLSSNFVCLPAGQGSAGSSCELLLGRATCGEDLFCYQMAGNAGVCTPFCDATHPCPNAAQCLSVSASNSGSVQICEP